MPTQREIHIAQALQRHTGCAWVHPGRPAEKTEKPKPDAVVHDDRALDLNKN